MYTVQQLGLLSGVALVVVGLGMFALGAASEAVFKGVQWAWRRSRPASLPLDPSPCASSEDSDLANVRVLTDDEAHFIRAARAACRTEALRVNFDVISRINAPFSEIPITPGALSLSADANALCDNPDCGRRTSGRVYCPHCGIRQMRVRKAAP